MSDPKPKTRYTKNNISVDVDRVFGGFVYLRQWPSGVEKQAIWANCYKMPLDVFLKQVDGIEAIELKDVDSSE